ncbi:MAG: hypothetical protein K9L21_02215 [Spirochaetia bacterium]|nr:hypothetical protein [Spirochaetia bacterium]
MLIYLVGKHKKSCRALICISVLGAAFVFLFSCGLPKAPFIIDASDVVFTAKSETVNYLIEDLYSNNFLDFTVEIDSSFDIASQGINLYYYYSPNEAAYSEIAADDLVDSSNSFQPQAVQINEETISVYRFTSSQSSNSPPTADIAKPAGQPYAIDGKLTIFPDVEGGDKVYIKLTLTDVTDGNDTSIENDLQLNRYDFKDSLLLTVNDAERPENLKIDDDYYLHIFGSFYARTDDTGFDNSTAIADVVYLGSVKFKGE